MLDKGKTIHTVVWDPSEPAATHPLTFSWKGRTYYYCFDFNKNVVELFSDATTNAARYDYTPFGELTSRPEPGIEQANPFRFSSEFHDDDLGLVYYNFRYYSPHDGRWIARDPINEQGGLNLYMFVGNNPVFLYDINGLKLTKLTKKDVNRRDFRKTNVDIAKENISKGKYGKTSFLEADSENLITCKKESNGKCKLYISNEKACLDVFIYGDIPTPTKRDKKGNDIIGHEEGHVDIYIENWNIIVDGLNKFDGQEFETEISCSETKENLLNRYNESLKTIDKLQLQYDSET